MKRPDPKKLAQLLSEVVLPAQDKQEILEALPYLSDEKLVTLFAKLHELAKEEQKMVTKIKTTNLKYQHLVEEEVEKAQEGIIEW